MVNLVYLLNPEISKVLEYLARATRIKLKEIPKPQDVVKRRLRNWLKEFLEYRNPGTLANLADELERISKPLSL